MDVQISEIGKYLLQSYHFSSQRRREDIRLDEIVIGGLGFKSKERTIIIIEKVIDGKEDNPTILKDKVSLAQKVVPVKFDSRGHA